MSGIDTGDVLLTFAPLNDVTKKKKAFEQAQRMTAIVENSSDAIIDKTLKGTILSWNPAAEKIFGYAAEEIIGQSIDLLEPADRDGEVRAILAKIKSGKPVEHYETIRLCKDKKLIWVSLSQSPIRDLAGVVIGASTIARDMTEAKKAFEAARAMIDATQDSLATVSSDGLILDANMATATLTGLPREQLIGTPFSDCFTDPEKADYVFKQVFAQGRVDEYALTIRHQDGTLTDVIYGASAYRGTGGETRGVFAAARTRAS